MSQTVVQINYKFSVARSEYEQLCAGAAQPISDQPGLNWKVWIINEAEREPGIYLFDDEASANAYVSGPIITALKSHPAVSSMSVKQFDVMEDLTAITRRACPECRPARIAQPPCYVVARLPAAERRLPKRRLGTTQLGRAPVGEKAAARWQPV